MIENGFVGDIGRLTLMFYQIYNGLTSYKVPGPAPFSC